jgi:hypothetical protein
MKPVTRRAYRIEWRDASGPWIAVPSRFATREDAETWAKGLLELEDVEASRVLGPTGDVLIVFERQAGRWP